MAINDDRIPRISIIVPTYIRTNYLKRAIRSVLGQTFCDFEILIVQNGEREYSRELINDFVINAAPIRYLYESKPCPVNARNVGIRAAKGEYIAFLDDDDEWLPEKLEKQIAVLDKNPNVGLVSCRVYLNDRKTGVEKLRGAEIEGCISFDSLLDKVPIKSLSCVLLRRSCFNSLGLLNPSFLLVNDYEFYFRLIEKSAIYNISVPLVRYYEHQQNMTSDIIAGTKEVIRLWTFLAKKYQRGEIKAGCLDKWRFRTRCARAYYEGASCLIDSKKYGKAAGFFASAVMRDPFIGTKIRWKRFNNLIFLSLRPYLGIIFYSARHFLQSAKRIYKILRSKRVIHATNI